MRLLIEFKEYIVSVENSDLKWPHNRCMVLGLLLQIWQMKTAMRILFHIESIN